MADDYAQLIARALQNHRAGDFGSAESTYREILRAHPDDAQALHFLGLLLHQTNRATEALPLMVRAVERAPSVVTYRANLAGLYLAIGRPRESIEQAHAALKLEPRHAVAHYNLGLALREAGELDEAVNSFRRALAISPAFGVAHENLGLMLLRLGRFDEGIAALDRAAQLSPKSASALTNLGVALMKLGELEPALDLFKRAEAADPTMHRAGSNQLIVLSYQSDVSSSSIVAAHVDWARRHAPAAQNVSHDNDRNPRRRLRVGFVSPDLRNHAIATFLLPLFEKLDRELVEITCYSHAGWRDAVTQRFESLADRWRDVLRLNDASVDQQIRGDQIDILIDLAGHTGDNRLPLFARKPAPVQATYLGWQNTTGVPAIDFRITDRHVDPPGLTERFHTEQLVRLPNIFAVYQPPDVVLDVQPLPASLHASAGDHITFGSFAKLDRLTAPMLEVWTNVLSRIPRSRLIMYAPGLHSSRARDRLRERFHFAGIEPDRVDLFGTVPFNAYLAAHANVDLLLDTFPFNNHTTTCHGLWMGVPTITLAGERCASRIGLSVMSNVGLPQFVAHTQSEFVDRAIEVASDVPALAELRRTMRDRMQSCALMDDSAFAREFESALRTCWLTAP